MRSNNKFGLVQHTESDEPGKRIFHARLYEADREGRIEYRTGKVFLVVEEGIEIALNPARLTTYDERNKVFNRDGLNAISSYLEFLSTTNFSGGELRQH